MKVIAAGFAKTGTKTIAKALRILGYTVYDYEENVYILGDQWKKILEKGGSNADFQKMYEGVDAVADLPACYFWEELHEAFPEAKILFMQRENEAVWLRSIKSQIKSASTHWFLSIIFTLSPTKNRIHKLGALIGKIVYGSSLYDSWPFNYVMNEMLLKKVYRSHNAHILQNAPKDKLLNYDVRQGWKPLCNILGCEIPDVPFPHKNRKSDIIDEMLKTSPMFQQMKKEVGIALAMIIAILSTLLYFLLYL